MAGLPGYAPAAPKTLQAAQAQIHAIDQQQGFHAPVVVPPTDGPGFVAPGQGIDSAVRYDVATGYQGNDPAQPVNFANGAGMVQGGVAPVQGLPGVAVMPGVTRVGNTFSNTAPGLPAGVEQNGNSFYSAPPPPSPEVVKQHLNAALVAHLQKSIQNAALPSWFNQEQQQQNAIQAKGAAAENYLRQTAATQQAQAAAQAAHLQAVQQQAQNSPIMTGIQSAGHDVDSGLLGVTAGIDNLFGNLMGWKSAQHQAQNVEKGAARLKTLADQQQAALSQAHGLGADAGAVAGMLGPMIMGPVGAALTYSQNAALQGAQNGDSFGRNWAGSMLQGASAVAGIPEAKMLSDVAGLGLKKAGAEAVTNGLSKALSGITKNAVTKAALRTPVARAIAKSPLAMSTLEGAVAGAAGGAANGAGQSVTNDQTFGQGVGNTAENAGLGTLMGAGGAALTHGATSLAGKLQDRLLAPRTALPAVTPESAAAQPAIAEPVAPQPVEVAAQPKPDAFDALHNLLANIQQPSPTEAAEGATPPSFNPNSEQDNLTGAQVLKNGQVTPVQGPSDVQAAQQAIHPSKVPFPPGYGTPMPGYNGILPHFDSPLDLAAYTIANRDGPLSEAAPKALAFVRKTLGNVTPEAAIKYGEFVKKAVKMAADPQHQEDAPAGSNADFRVRQQYDPYMRNAPGRLLNRPQMPLESEFPEPAEEEPAQNTAAAVAPVSEAAAGKPAGEPVVTPANVQGMNAEADGLIGDDKQQVQAATTSPDARVADDAKKLDEKMQGEPSIKPATPEQEAAINAQTPKEPPTPAEETAAAFGATSLQPAIDRLTNSTTGTKTPIKGRSSVAQFVTKLRQAGHTVAQAHQIVQALVDQGHAVLYGKDNNKGPSFTLVHQENPEMAANRPSTPVQVVQWHLENQVRKQLQAEKQTATGARLKQIETKLLHSDFSNEPLVNPSIHEPWMQNHFGISKGDANDAAKSLVGSNELEVLTPQDAAELAKQHGRSLDEQEVAANTPGDSYILSAQDPRLTATRLSTNAKDLQDYGQQFLGARQSELQNRSNNEPSQIEKKKLDTLIDRTFNVGGDSFHHATAGEYNDEIGENAAAQQVSADQKRDVEQAPVAELDPNDPATLQKLQETKDRLANKVNPVNAPNSLDDADLSTDTGEQPEQLKGSKKTTQPKKNNGLEDELARISKERAAVDPNSKHAKTRLKDLDDQEDFARNNPDFYNTTLPSIATTATSHGVDPTAAMQKFVDFVDRILGKGRAHVVMEHRPGVFGYTDLQKIALTARGVMHDAHRVLTHEAAHIIRELYLTDAEKKMTDQALAPGTRRYERLMTIARKNGISHIIKGQPHERFSYYAEAVSKGLIPKPTGILGRIYSKVLAHMERLHSALHGAGYRNIDDIMQAMQEGKFAERGPVRSLEEGRSNLSSAIQDSRELNSVAPRGVAPYNAPGVNYDIAGDEKPRSGHLSAAGKFVADMPERFEPVNIKALHNPDVRSVHELLQERGELARKTIAQAVHIAPHFLSPHVGDNLKGLIPHGRVDKALREGDHSRKIFSPEELTERGLTPHEQSLYHEYLDGREPGFQAMLGEDEIHHRTTMEVLKQKAEQLVEKQAKNAAIAQDPTADPAARAKAIQAIQSAAEPILQDRADELKRRESYTQHVEKLRNEGYIPHSRTGNFIARIEKWIPKSIKREQDLKAEMERRTDEKAALEQLMGLDSAGSKALYDNREKVLDPANGISDEERQAAKELFQHHQRLEAIPKALAKIAKARAKPGFQDPLQQLDDMSASSFTTKGEAKRHIAKVLAGGSREKAEAAARGIVLKSGGVAHNDSPTGATLNPKEIYDMLEQIRSSTGGKLGLDQQMEMLRKAGAARSQAMKDLASRKDIAGETGDLVHELSQFTGYHAHAFASAQISSRLQTALHNLSDPKTGNAGNAEYVAHWLKGLAEREVSKDPIMSKVRAAAMYMMLGGKLTPAAYTLGANSQMSLAHLSRNENSVAAGARYLKALKQTALMTPKRLAKAVAENKGLGKLTPEETQSMYEAHLRGITDAQYAYLQDNANPHVKGASAVARLRRAAGTALMSPLGVTESRLRQATFLAALRQHADLKAQGFHPLMSARDRDGKQLVGNRAFDYAREMTKLSNQSFEPEDQSPIFNMANGDGKTLFMFQNPMLQIDYALAHMARTDPKVAAATLAGTTALGGLRALPMYATAMALAGGANELSAAYGGPSFDNSPNAQIDKELDKVHPGLGSLAEHGIPDAVLQHFLGKSTPDISQYFQLGSFGDNGVAGTTNEMVKLAGGTPATRAAPIPLVSMFKDIVGTGRGIANLPSDGWDVDPVLRHGGGDSLIKSIYQATHAAETGENTNAEGEHPYAVSHAGMVENALGFHTNRQDEMFNKIGQIDYRAGIRNLVESRANMLATLSVKDGKPAALKSALGLIQNWNKQHPDDATMFSPKVLEKAEMAKHESPVMAQMIKQMRSMMPMGLKTYGTN